MLLLFTNMVAFIRQLKPKAKIIRLPPISPHTYRNKVTLVTIVATEWSLLGAQLVLMELNLPVLTATRSGWVMMMTVLVVFMASIIGSRN
jgi:hypothetical protein